MLWTVFAPRHCRPRPAIGRSIIKSESLKLRLCLLITSLIGLLTIAGGIYIVRRAQNDIHGEVRSAVNLAAHYLDTQLAILAQRPEGTTWSPALLHLGDLRDLRHIRVLVFDRTNTELDASVSDESDERAPGWFERLVAHALPDLPEYQRELQFRGTAVGYLIVRPDPGDEIAEIWNVSRGLLQLLIVFVLAVNGLVWWAVGRALKPIRTISEALGQIGGGNLRARLPALEIEELSGLSRDFNHMAARLEASVAENQVLTRRLIATQDDERKRIARELHDEIGQCVTAIHADAVAIRQSPAALDATVQASATAIVEVTSTIKDMVRGMLQRLRPAAVEGLSLAESLRHLLSAFKQHNEAWTCTLSVGDGTDASDPDISMTIYRVVQEALTNIARHARATTVFIDARILTDSPASGRESPLLRVSITDDGKGFDPLRIGGRFGLLGMRERLHALDGHLAVTSVPGKGTSLVAEIPWTRARRAA